MSELREMIEKTLKEMDALDVKISVEKYQEEIGANDKENIGFLAMEQDTTKKWYISI
mgnify:CR=1 FL=1